MWNWIPRIQTLGDGPNDWSCPTFLKGLGLETHRSFYSDCHMGMSQSSGPLKTFSFLIKSTFFMILWRGGSPTHIVVSSSPKEIRFQLSRRFARWHDTHGCLPCRLAWRRGGQPRRSNGRPGGWRCMDPIENGGYSIAHVSLPGGMWLYYVMIVMILVVISIIFFIWSNLHYVCSPHSRLDCVEAFFDIHHYLKRWSNLTNIISVVVSNIFYFHPYLGKIPILTNIFQMGWNHQPVIWFVIQMFFVQPATSHCLRDFLIKKILWFLRFPERSKKM